jgi:hypothetical protein
MDDISISRRGLLAAMLLLVALAAVLFGLPHLRAWLSAPPVSDQAGVIADPQAGLPDDSDLAASRVAVAGALAFYTLDVRQGQQAWLDRLCATSSQAGCAIFSNVIVPAIWESLAADETLSTAEVSAEERVLARVAPSRANAPVQVWRLQVQLSTPWPVQRTPLTGFTALALVIWESDAWRFERFLTEDEVQAIAREASS